MFIFGVVEERYKSNCYNDVFISVEQLALGADRRISVVLVLEESSKNVLKGATGRKSEHLFLGLVETRGAAVVLDSIVPVIRHGKQHKDWPLTLGPV